MRNVKDALRGTHIKIPASPYGRFAGIFMCVPLSPFFTFRIAIRSHCLIYTLWFRQNLRYIYFHRQY